MTLAFTQASSFHKLSIPPSLVIPFLNRAGNSRCTVITDLDTSKRSKQKGFSCCDAILETGHAVSMRSDLLVAHEKLGQLPLLTVYVEAV